MKYLKPTLKERLSIAWIITSFPEFSLKTDLMHIYNKFSHSDKVKNPKFVKFSIIFQRALLGTLW